MRVCVRTYVCVCVYVCMHTCMCVCMVFEGKPPRRHQLQDPYLAFPKIKTRFKFSCSGSLVSIFFPARAKGARDSKPNTHSVCTIQNKKKHTVRVRQSNALRSATTVTANTPHRTFFGRLELALLQGHQLRAIRPVVPRSGVVQRICLSLARHQLADNLTIFFSGRPGRSKRQIVTLNAVPLQHTTTTLKPQFVGVVIYVIQLIVLYGC